MAFKFRSKSSLPATATTNRKQTGNGPELENNSSDNNGTNVLPKFTNAQMNKLTKVYPSWLKDKSGPKQLPGIYQGVLGQVQLQPGISFDSHKSTNGQRLILTNKQQPPSQQQQSSLDYMNRFTDTERVHQLLSASQLSNDTLATIWAHVNQTFPGKLTNREVCLALALIAIFQRFGEGEIAGEALKKDPFSLVKAEKKPPVPVLYPTHGGGAANKQNVTTKASGGGGGGGAIIVSSKSIPDKLSGSASSGALLVDFGDDNDDEDDNKERENSNLTNYLNSPWCNKSTTTSPISSSRSNQLLSSKSKDLINSSSLSCDQHQQTKCFNSNNTNNSLSLIDMLDGDMFEIEFYKLTQIWLKFLSAMRTIFKRSFDILNVENSRRSAIEALKSEQGKQFSKHLCLCYPIAHNIKFKIDQLNNIGSSCSNQVNEAEQIITNSSTTTTTTTKKQNELFESDYITKIDDLMNSINEYWAVLINLFHESGQTKFIELIMDGLNYKRPTVVSRTISELKEELNGSRKPTVCSICHTNFYLTNSNCLTQSLMDDDSCLGNEDLELIGNEVELISNDDEYYYHSKCANFWLNNVDLDGQLPLSRKIEPNILSPASLTTTPL